MIGHRAWATDDMALINMTAANVPVATIATRLGRSYGSVIERRQILRRAGRIERLSPGGARAWTHAERQKLAALVEAGRSYTSIARSLGRTRASVLIRCKRERCRVLRVEGVYTSRGVQELLGLTCSKAVVRWIERGWLTARNAGERDRPLWRISQIDLWEMLENEETWMAWHADRITDADLRAWAMELRANGPVWLPVGEVARRLHVGIASPRVWIANGELPGVRYGNWWVREDDVARFVPPCERPRRRRAAL